MKKLFGLGVLASCLFLFVGCGGEQAPSTDAETEALNSSPDYEAEMMGTMGGGSGGAAPAAGGADKGPAAGAATE